MVIGLSIYLLQGNKESEKQSEKLRAIIQLFMKYPLSQMELESSPHYSATVLQSVNPQTASLSL